MTEGMSVTPPWRLSASARSGRPAGLALGLILVAARAAAQSAPPIEDDSFLLEEAYKQEGEGRQVRSKQQVTGGG